MIRLSKKFIRRGITGLALLAPLVYLFGSQFMALNGAHGEMIFADESTVSEATEYLIVKPSNMLVNKTLSTSLGTEYLPIDGAGYRLSPLYNVSAGVYTFHYPDDRLFRFYVYTDGLLTTYNEYSDYQTHQFTYTLLDNQSFAFVIYGMQSPISIDIISYGYDIYVDGLKYRQTLFSSMFGNSNFLTSWGQDAISDNPHGFAPFGNMLQFVDENMLHLSDLQIGLMGYGYFYYCAHVLLFVCFFDLTTFFLSWILRITHKFGGADYED